MISATTNMYSYPTDGKKIEADGLCSISIFYLNQIGLLKGCGGEAEIEWSRSILDGKQTILIAHIQTFIRPKEAEVLISEISGEKRVDQSIRLTTTPCFFGGIRYWFLCSGANCTNYRIGSIYLLDNEFSCRKCLNLAYHSQNAPNMSEFAPLTDFMKIDQLRLKIKRPYYRGEPTKKQRKLELLCYLFKTQLQRKGKPIL